MYPALLTTKQELRTESFKCAKASVGLTVGLSVGLLIGLLVGLLVGRFVGRSLKRLTIHPAHLLVYLALFIIQV